MKKVLIIVNPSAGDEQGLECSRQLEKIYSVKNIQTKLYETTGDDNFPRLIQQAMDKGYKTLALFGGDGTVSAIVNSIVELKQRPKLILLPSGTTNNFARTLTKDQTREQILQAIESDDLKEVHVDVGQINDQYFVSSVAVGVLPTVGWETDEELKEKLGSFAYFLEGLKVVKEEKQESFNLKIASGQTEQIIENVFLFIVGLSNSIFGIQTFFAEASVDDGKLHYFALEKTGILPEIRSMLKYIAEKEATDDRILTGSFQTASLESESELNFLIDGERGPRFPIELDVLPEHLILIVPQSH